MSFGFVDLPLEMFYVMFAIFGAILAVAFVSRQPILVMFAGIFLLIIFIPVNTVIAASPIATVTSVTSGGSLEYEVSQIYTPTTNHNATSSGTVTIMTQGAGTTANAIRSGATQIVTQKIVSSSAALHAVYFNEITLSLSKTGAPTGTATIGVFDSTSGNIITACNTLDVSTLTTSQADYVFTCSSDIVLFGALSPDRVGLKYTGGDVSNLVNVYSTSAGDVYDGTLSYRSAFTNSNVWSDQTNADVRMALKYVSNKLYARDGSQTSYWINNTPSESPLCLDSDLGQIALLNGFRVTGLTSTQIVNVVKLYTSASASSWDFRESINLTDSTDRQVHLLDASYSSRYVRLCVDEYGSGTTLWRLNELDYVFATAELVGAETVDTYSYEDDVIDVDPTVKVLSTMFGALMIIFGAWMFRDGDD